MSDVDVFPVSQDDVHAIDAAAVWLVAAAEELHRLHCSAALRSRTPADECQDTVCRRNRDSAAELKELSDRLFAELLRRDRAR